MVKITHLLKPRFRNYNPDHTENASGLYSDPIADKVIMKLFEPLLVKSYFHQYQSRDSIPHRKVTRGESHVNLRYQKEMQGWRKDEKRS
ncbi:hypothetical protein NPIL_689431 [Nephila pilipes]|uniref:Uncharacterized protein n=1 Tax=Nephila pilipes TaxID=299642 RepID=A0A8X6QJ16_NEPPI|nr:hypothetical protein NPIL_689431 [Nephila pilipes]